MLICKHKLQAPGEVTKWSDQVKWPSEVDPGQWSVWWWTWVLNSISANNGLTTGQHCGHAGDYTDHVEASTWYGFRVVQTEPSVGTVLVWTKLLADSLRPANGVQANMGYMENIPWTSGHADSTYPSYKINVTCQCKRSIFTDTMQCMLIVCKLDKCN